MVVSVPQIENHVLIKSYLKSLPHYSYDLSLLESLVLIWLHLEFPVGRQDRKEFYRVNLRADL
jgi:hypothetical protein